MQLTTATAEQVTYNPANGMFEALVTLRTESGTYRYPCAFEGPLNMPLSIAAHRLSQQAKQRHTARNDLRARTPLGSDQATIPQAA